MKDKRNATARTGIERKTTLHKRPTRMPRLAPKAGRVAPEPETSASSTLWENENFAVTSEGLVLKQLLIPTARLSEVGSVTKSIAEEHWGKPFIEAIHHAVMIHHPTEFPNGLKKNDEPVG
jgi:hypothetical protein